MVVIVLIACQISQSRMSIEPYLSGRPHQAFPGLQVAIMYIMVLD